MSRPWHHDPQVTRWNSFDRTYLYSRSEGNVVYDTSSGDRQREGGKKSKESDGRG